MIKSASFIDIRMCANCMDPHIVLMDENSEPFAEAILVGKQGQEFVETVKKALHKSAVARLKGKEDI